MRFNRFTFILVIFFSFMLCLHLSSSNIFAENIYDFENFTEEDSINFVLEHNIEIPKQMLNWDGLGDFTKNIILQSYYYPNYNFQFDYYDSQKYAEDIRLAVASYIVPITVYIDDTIPIPCALQENTVIDENGNWVTSGGYYNPDWKYYNCYAYAINRCEMSNFYDSQGVYQIGDMCGFEIPKDESIDVWRWAEIVKQDLAAMGYSNILITETIPDVNDSQQLICLRGDTASYHFMRYDIETDAWYHKPGTSAVLKYNYIPSNDREWQKEFSENGEEYFWYGRSYDHEIIFIRYSKNIIDTTPNSSQNIFIQPNKDVFYEVNINEADHYRLKLIAGYEMDYELYDSNFDMVVSDSGNNNVDTCLSLTPGKYYLRINFTSSQSYSELSASLCVDYDNDNNVNSNTHTSVCNGCGYSIVKPHTFECDGLENSLHYEKCSVCGYRNSQCTNIRFISSDTDGHLVMCVDCEYTKNMAHNFVYGIESSTHHKYYCIDCGYVQSRGRHTLKSFSGDDKHKECITCGALVYVGGNDIFPIQSKPPKDLEEEIE